MVRHRHSEPAIWKQALLIAVVLLASALLAPTLSHAQSASTISGVIYLSDGKALPAGAVFTIQLADVTVVNAPAVVVTEQTFGSSSGEPPFTFTLAYDPGRINPSHRYTLQGNIRLGTQILYTTTMPYPVLTAGAGSTTGSVQITMWPASSGALPPSSAGTTPLLAAAALLLGALATMGLRRGLARAA